MRAPLPAKPHWSRNLVRGSVVVVTLGLVVSVVMFLRPWMECSDFEDAALGIGCPIEGPSIVLVDVGLLLTLVGLGGLLTSVVATHAKRKAS